MCFNTTEKIVFFLTVAIIVSQKLMIIWGSLQGIRSKKLLTCRVPKANRQIFTNKNSISNRSKEFRDCVLFCFSRISYKALPYKNSKLSTGTDNNRLT
jgi:hypothetical protein